MIIFSQESIYNKTLNKNISIEQSNLKKIKNILEKQKKIISKHYVSKVSKAPNNPNQILELHQLVTSFNNAFEKNNKSLQIADDLIKQLNSITQSTSSNMHFIENEINFYNNFYNTNYPELIESISFLTEFIQNLTNSSPDTTNYSIQGSKNVEVIDDNMKLNTNNHADEVLINSSVSLSSNTASEVETRNFKIQFKQPEKPEISEEIKQQPENNFTVNSSVVQAVTSKSEKKEIRKKILVEIEKNRSNTTVDSAPEANSPVFASSISEGASNQVIYNDNNNSTNIVNNLESTKNILPKDDDALKNVESTITQHSPKKNITVANNNSLSGTTFVTKITSLPLQDNNTLRISEKDGSVYLPFKVSDLKQEFSTADETYNGIVDLVTTKYIVPITKYKNGVTSRFKEAYNLVSRKEKKSPFKAFEVGMEVAFNRSLHPAVISACKSLDQLDSYLDALDKKDLSKFDSFNIEFDGLPLKNK